uniref:Uncharacterized protein n=1 Tax=Rhizophora mucronata TaxID=61149 RepID=A0A2P2ILX0_RHIMU
MMLRLMVLVYLMTLILPSPLLSCGRVRRPKS